MNLTFFFSLSSDQSSTWYQKHSGTLVWILIHLIGEFISCKKYICLLNHTKLCKKVVRVRMIVSKFSRRVIEPFISIEIFPDIEKWLEKKCEGTYYIAKFRNLIWKAFVPRTKGDHAGLSWLIPGSSVWKCRCIHSYLSILMRYLWDEMIFIIVMIKRNQKVSLETVTSFAGV